MTLANITADLYSRLISEGMEHVEAVNTIAERTGLTRNGVRSRLRRASEELPNTFPRREQPKLTEEQILARRVYRYTCARCGCPSDKHGTDHRPVEWLTNVVFAR